MKNALIKLFVLVYIINFLPAHAVLAINTAPGFFYAPENDVLTRGYAERIDEKTLTYAVKNARGYGATDAAAGVVPHHLTAAPLIAGFFSAVGAGDAYDAVVLLGPDHYGTGNDITVSGADWGHGVECGADLAAAIMDIELTDGSIIFDDADTTDHAVGALIPFIGRYLPGAAVAPVLINKSLSYADALMFAAALTEIIGASGQNILLLCSVDFSHYLTPDAARARDAETLDAMKRYDYRQIYGFTDSNADCRAALIVFLYFLATNGFEFTVLDHADASAFTGPCINETTSYFILVGH